MFMSCDSLILSSPLSVVTHDHGDPVLWIWIAVQYCKVLVSRARYVLMAEELYCLFRATTQLARF